VGLLAGAEERVSAIEPGEQRVEITIQDSTFLKTKTTQIRAELPLVSVIHNDDKIRHGFTSAMLKGLAVEGEGIELKTIGQIHPTNESRNASSRKSSLSHPAPLL
jgi:hypothetical protein